MEQLLQKLLPGPLPETTTGFVRAVREIFQSLTLLGLWRARFFEHSAFYGGTALSRLRAERNRWDQPLNLHF